MSRATISLPLTPHPDPAERYRLAVVLLRTGLKVKMGSEGLTLQCVADATGINAARLENFLDRGLVARKSLICISDYLGGDFPIDWLGRKGMS